MSSNMESWATYCEGWVLEVLRGGSLSGNDLLDLWCKAYPGEEPLDVNAVVWSMHSRGLVKFTDGWLVERC